MSDDNVNVDDLFDRIDSIAEDMEKDKQKAKKSGGGGGKKTNFKNLDMTFLGGVRGTYELKIFVDSTGALSEDVYLHTVKVGKDKVTIPCAGADCEVCKRQKKLEDLKNKASWKFRKYKLNKILIKLGDIPEGGGDLKAGGTYVAYVNDQYFKPLIDSIRTNKKYYKDDIAKMLKPTERSGGFLVNSAKANKGTSYNFSFIPTMGIDPVDVKTVLGENYKLANFGYFRNNFMPEQKYKKAIQLMDGLLMATVGKQEGKDAPAPEKDKAPEPEKDPAKDQAEEAKEEKKEESTPEPEEKKEESKPDPEPEKEEKKESSDSGEELDPIKYVEEHGRDPKDIGSNDKPKCYSQFDPSNKTCTEQCQFKRECLMQAMDNGTI